MADLNATGKFYSRDCLAAISRVNLKELSSSISKLQQENENDFETRGQVIDDIEKIIGESM